MLDISWAVIKKVEALPDSTDYLSIGNGKVTFHISTKSMKL